MAICLQSIMVFYPFHHLACAVSIGLGYFLFTLSFIECIENGLKSIENMTKEMKSKSDILKQLSTVVSSHTEIKRLSIRSAWLKYS